MHAFVSFNFICQNFVSAFTEIAVDKNIVIIKIDNTLKQTYQRTHCIFYASSESKNLSNKIAETLQFSLI